jgi:hypothetical protein
MIKEIVTDYLNSIEWKYSLDKRDTIRFGVSLDNMKVDCILDIREQSDILLFYTVLPVMVAEELRIKVSEFIARANYGLRIGNLEMDFKDGEVRYKTYANTNQSCINTDIVRHLIHANIQTFEKYAEGILKVVYSDLSPEDAIEMVESDNNADDQDISELLKELE